MERIRGRAAAGYDESVRLYGADFVHAVDGVSDAVLDAGYSIHDYETTDSSAVLYCGAIVQYLDAQPVQVTAMTVFVEKSSMLTTRVRIQTPVRHVTARDAQTMQDDAVRRIFTLLDERFGKGSSPNT